VSWPTGVDLSDAIVAEKFETLAGTTAVTERGSAKTVWKSSENRLDMTRMSRAGRRILS